MLAEKGFCAAHAISGWARQVGFMRKQPDTIPLYRCYNSVEQSHFAFNEPDCEKLGTNEHVLGYALKQ